MGVDRGRMHVILAANRWRKCIVLVPGVQVAAVGGCERDVVHRMNEGIEREER